MKLTKRDFLLLAVIIYFTFIGGTYYSQLNFPVRVANQIIVTVILGWWLLAKLGRGQGLPATSLDLPIVLYLMVNLFSALLGHAPRYSLEMSWFSVVHVLALYLLVDLARQGWTARLTWAFYMASAVVCLVGLAEFAGWYFGTPFFADFAEGWADIGGWQQPIPPRIYRLSITLNGSTPLAAYLALLITPAIGLIASLPRRNENRQALIIWLVLAFLVQVLTFSRAGILALGVSLSLFIAGWANISGKGWPEILAYWARRSRLQQALIILSGLVAAGLGLFWLQRSFTGRAGSTSFRFQLWGAALEIFQNHPLTGAGPANFGRALLRLNDPALPRKQIATAHSIYLNTAAELGLLGLIVGGLLIGAFGWIWWQRWRKSADRSEQIRLLACGAALAGLAAQTLVDTYTATPNMLVMLAIVAYIIGAPKPGSLSFRRLYTGYAALGVLLIYLFGLAWIALADLHFQRSFKEEAVGHPAGAIVEATQARALDPALPLRTFRLALLEARLAHQTDDPALIEAAIEHYRAGLRQEPILGVNSANLAGLLWQQGRADEAIEMLQRTVAATEEPLYLVNLGHFFEQTGRWAEATEAYGQALAFSPGLAASGFWQATPERAARWPNFVDAAIESISAGDNELAERSLRVNLALARQDFETAAGLLQSLPPGSDERLQTTLTELYLIQEQPQQLAKFLPPKPKKAEDYFLWGWLELQRADYSDAAQLLKIAGFLGQKQAYYYLGQLLESQGQLEAAEMAYSRGYSPRATSENVAVNIYGRFGGNDLAPQLLRIGLGPWQARAWLALARLYEKQQRYEDAARIYRILISEDPYLEVAQERLNLLVEKTSP